MTSLQQQPKLHCYGSKAAVTFEGTTKSNSDGIQYTLNIDVAPMEDQRVDWNRKISLQLSHNELVMLVGICLGYAKSHHLQRPGKGIKIERQSGNLFINASAGKGNLFALPLNVGDTARLADFALMQLARGSFTGSIEAVLASVRGACALLRDQ